MFLIRGRESGVVERHGHGRKGLYFVASAVQKFGAEEDVHAMDVEGLPKACVQ